MTSDDAAVVREMLARMKKERAHFSCPDYWSDCNDARRDADRLVAALERAVAALFDLDHDEKGMLDQYPCGSECPACAAEKALAGIRKDLEGRT